MTDGTIGTFSDSPPLTAEMLKKLLKDLQENMPLDQWTLLAPSGEVWTGTLHQMLLALGRKYAESQNPMLWDASKNAS